MNFVEKILIKSQLKTLVKKFSKDFKLEITILGGVFDFEKGLSKIGVTTDKDHTVFNVDQTNMEISPSTVNPVLKEYCEKNSIPWPYKFLTITYSVKKNEVETVLFFENNTKKTIII